MKRNHPSMIGFLSACVLWALPLVAAGGSAGDLVARGNAAYAEGRYDEALTLYDEASVTMPESPRLYFNRGTVRYRMEDYAAAIGDFKEAALRAREPALTSRAKYNLGNCAFRQAQRQRDSDLKKAIDYCQESIAYYQEARDLDPEYREAAENIEIVRLYVKVLLDEQKKKEEEQQQQQEEQENLVQKLQKLIKRQNEIIGKNEGLRNSRPDAADPAALEGWKEQLQALTGEQGTLRADTGVVLDEMRQTASQIRQQAAAGGAQGTPPPPQDGTADAAAMAEKIEKAAGHVVNAMADAQQAETALRAELQGPALGNQANAVRNLEEAVKELADDQQQQQQQQSGDQNQDQQEQEDQQDQQDGEQEDQQQQDEQHQDSQDGRDQQQDQQEQEEMEARAERVEDILDEEKENQKQRQPVRPGRVRPVDKDW